MDLLKMKRLQGSALPTILVASVLICLLVLFAVTLSGINTLFHVGYHNKKQYRNHLNSAVTLYCSDSTLYNKLDETNQFQLYPEDKTVIIHYNKYAWGLYECFCTNPPPKKKDGINTFIGQNKQAALWAYSQEMGSIIQYFQCNFQCYLFCFCDLVT